MLFQNKSYNPKPITSIKQQIIKVILTTLSLPLALVLPFFPQLRRKMAALVQFQADDPDLAVLMLLLQTAAIDPRPEAVYPVLHTYRDRLDENLGEQLYRWSASRLKQVTPTEAEDIATTLVNFSNRLCTFKPDRDSQILEIARLGYEAALIFYGRDNFPQNWAKIQYNLGCLYRDRKRGQLDDNIRMAISYLENAQKVFTAVAYPQESRLIQHHLMAVYQQQSYLQAGNNLEELISNS